MAFDEWHLSISEGIKRDDIKSRGSTKLRIYKGAYEIIRR